MKKLAYFLSQQSLNFIVEKMIALFLFKRLVSWKVFVVYISC